MGTDEALLSIDFSTFILSLTHSALIQLGLAPHPEGHKVEMELELARQSIDLLGMLEEKTKGNLTGEEERLLSQSLFDLRVKFVEASKRADTRADQRTESR